MSATLFGMITILATIAANAAPISFQSSERQTALMELYTSEGCSSCPPAETWLSQLKASPGLWNDFVPVAFHVDYWNYLGWREKWSSKQFSDRQQNYAAVWGSENIYTPEFVLNGKEWHDWFGLREAPGLSGTKTGILTVSYEGTNHWQPSFIPATGGTTAYEVYVSLLNSELSSDVKAGENEGHHLNHDFAPLNLMKESMADKGGEFQGNFPLDTNLKETAGRLALAVWVTRAGELEPVQAVGGWLPKP